VRMRGGPTQEYAAPRPHHPGWSIGAPHFLRWSFIHAHNSSTATIITGMFFIVELQK
jgi:hypothetical protein